MAFLPPDQRGQQLLLERTLIADEVVVHKEDRPVPTEPVKTVQLGHHLRRRLGAWPCPNIAVTLQKSQSNGHPRENCTLIEA